MNETLSNLVIPANNVSAVTPQPAEWAESSDLRQSLMRQQALVAMGRRVIAPPRRDILLSDAGRLLAELLEVDRYLVAERDAEGAQLYLTLARLSSQENVAPSLDQEADAGGYESLAGYVLEVAHPLAVSNLAQETRFRDRWLTAQGVVSALAVPLVLPERSFGALAACSRVQRSFSAEDVLFAETISHLLTAAIARSEAEAALEAQRRLSASMLDSVGAIVLTLDSEGRIRQANQACQRLSGLSLTELQGRPIWEALFVPEEALIFQLILTRLREDGSPVECEGQLATRNSGRRHIAWTYSLLPEPHPREALLLATGIDITEQRRAEQRAAQAEQANQQSAASNQNEDKRARSQALLHQERRGRPRRSYPYRQMVAPILQGQLPPCSAFVEIECNDISAGGFSYLASQPPESNALVVALGVPPKLTYLRAEIAHVNRVKQGETTLYMIGCTYTGRVQF